MPNTKILTASCSPLPNGQKYFTLFKKCIRNQVIVLLEEIGGAWFFFCLQLLILCYKFGKGKVAQSCPTLCDSPWNSPGQNTGVGSLPLLQGIFPIQGSNPGLPHYRQIFYQLSHKGSPRILKWVAYPFCSRSSQPKNQTRVSCITDRFLTNWAIREAQKVKFAQSCPTLCNPMDYTVDGILQARILEWVAFPFSRRSPSLPRETRDQPQVSRTAGRFFTSWATKENLSSPFLSHGDFLAFQTVW